MSTIETTRTGTLRTGPAPTPDHRALHAVPLPAVGDAPPGLDGAAVHPARRPIDREAAMAAVADLLRALGRDPAGPHLRDTPRRVADAYAEMLAARPFELTTFPNEEGYDEVVLVREIPVHSLCEHHLLPFDGVAQVAYLPGERIVGLSKLARVVEHFARDLQVQERLTRQVADFLQERLRPRGVAVAVEAAHLCMSLRGVAVPQSRTHTSTLLGQFRTDPQARAEILALMGRPA